MRNASPSKLFAQKENKERERRERWRLDYARPSVLYMRVRDTPDTDILERIEDNRRREGKLIYIYCISDSYLLCDSRRADCSRNQMAKRIKEREEATFDGSCISPLFTTQRKKERKKSERDDY